MWEDEDDCKYPDSVVWDDELGTYVNPRQLKFPNLERKMDDMINEIYDNGHMPVKSGLTGELIKPSTGKPVNDDGKVLDKNGWVKDPNAKHGRKDD